MTFPNEAQLEFLSATAWAARQNARLLSATAVGCAALSDTGNAYAGCNIQHRFRSHDIHAETNAIGSMLTAGDKGLSAIFVAAERDRFTPCGACMDWIFEFGGSKCVVLWQAESNGPVHRLTAGDLMPYYPR
jgi:cytidine deaminase